MSLQLCCQNKMRNCLCFPLAKDVCYWFDQFLVLLISWLTSIPSRWDMLWHPNFGVKMFSKFYSNFLRSSFWTIDHDLIFIAKLKSEKIDFHFWSFNELPWIEIDENWDKIKVFKILWNWDQRNIWSSKYVIKTTLVFHRKKSSFKTRQD